MPMAALLAAVPGALGDGGSVRVTPVGAPGTVRPRSRPRSRSSFTDASGYALLARMPLVLLLLALVVPAAALSTSQLRERSIYQVITDRFARPDGLQTPCDPAQRAYCGGGWKGIERNLAYIQGMGFDTVWISPIVANIPGVPGSESYHGYWASNIFELNRHFGTEEDLLDLSAALHAKGMYLMVDVVANHMGWGGSPGAADDDVFFDPRMMSPPFNTEKDYHPYCTPDDWEDQQQVEQCWLDGYMPDLNTESTKVARTLEKWIYDLVHRYGIDAIRVDTVKHVRKDFWPGFVHAAGVAAMGEVLHGDELYLRQYQEHSMGSLLDYATFYHLRRTFKWSSTSIDELTSMITRVHRHMPDPTLLGSFLDNHDQPRLASETRDQSLVLNAAVYPFINDGFPIVYQGQEHGLSGGDDPHNREALWLSAPTSMYRTFGRINHARRRAVTVPGYLTTLLRHHRLDMHTAALVKPPLVSVLTNTGAGAAPRAYYLPGAFTTYAPLIPVVDVLTGTILATDPGGGIAVPIVNGEPRVLMPLSVWEGRGAAWQSTREPISPAVASPQRRKGPRSSNGGHSRGSSKSSVFSWLRGSK